MKKKKIIIAGTISNVANSIKIELDQVTKALSHHEIVAIHLIESDSTDQTCAKLEDLKKNLSMFSYESLGTLAPQFPLRSSRIAHCRNKYIQSIQDGSLPTADYIFVTDLDGTNSSLTTEGVDAAISFLQSVPGSAVSANQKYKYYDIWALRHETWNPGDCWHNYHYLSQQLDIINAHDICNLSKMIHIDADASPIEVKSAFGGATIYHSSHIGNALYKGITTDGLQVCEHVAFNSEYSKNGGRVFIHPKFINHDVSQHVINAENFKTQLSSDSMVQY